MVVAAHHARRRVAHAKGSLLRVETLRPSGRGTVAGQAVFDGGVHDRSLFDYGLARPRWCGRPGRARSAGGPRLGR